jgi:hypothetical protein
MNFAFDIDGVLDAFPAEMLAVCSSLQAGANHVYIITGVEEDAVTKEDVANKEAYLIGLGFGKGSYFKLIVLPKPHDTNKAKAIEDNDIAMLFDNNKDNVKAAKSLCPCWLLWNTKEG